jgi:hypothetical protein
MKYDGMHSSNKTQYCQNTSIGHFDEGVELKLLVVVCDQHASITSACVASIYGEL